VPACACVCGERDSAVAYVAVRVEHSGTAGAGAGTLPGAVQVLVVPATARIGARLELGLGVGALHVGEAILDLEVGPACRWIDGSGSAGHLARRRHRWRRLASEYESHEHEHEHEHEYRSDGACHVGACQLMRCGAVWCEARTAKRERQACVIADIDVALVCLKVYLFIHSFIHPSIHTQAYRSLDSYGNNYHFGI